MIKEVHIVKAGHTAQGILDEVLQQGKSISANVALQLKASVQNPTSCLTFQAHDALDYARRLRSLCIALTLAAEKLEEAAS